MKLFKVLSDSIKAAWVGKEDPQAQAWPIVKELRIYQKKRQCPFSCAT